MLRSNRKTFLVFLAQCTFMVTCSAQWVQIGLPQYGPFDLSGRREIPYLRAVTVDSSFARLTPARIGRNVPSSTVSVPVEGFALEKSGTPDGDIPLVLALHQNYPNPFNPVTMLKFELPEDGLVSIKVFDILGREVATLVDEYKSAGRYQTEFDAHKLASGIYVYRIQQNDNTLQRRMITLK